MDGARIVASIPDIGRIHPGLPNSGIIVLDLGLDLVENLIPTMVLWLLLFLISNVLTPVAFGAIWLLCRAMVRTMPCFLRYVNHVRFGKGDRWQAGCRPDWSMSRKCLTLPS